MRISILWSIALSVLVALLLFVTTGKPYISIGGGEYYDRSYGGSVDRYGNMDREKFHRWFVGDEE
jgi:hypothetical protein